MKFNYHEKVLPEAREVLADPLESSEDSLLEEEAAPEGGPEEEAGSEEEEIEASADPAVLYLREMASVPLLTRAREVELAKEMEEGRDDLLEA
ncbi:MAG: sigma-70 factor domain-containing protein, partial [Candidatus Binatia bacterium]